MIEMLNNFIWLIVGVILSIFIPIIKQALRNKIQRNRVKFFITKEKELNTMFLGIQDKTGFIHTIICEVDFNVFGISNNEIELLNKTLKKGESKRIYLDIE